MATIKAYLYCAKAGEKLVRYSKKGMNTLGYATENELSEASLNGTVCFSCDIEKVEEIENTLLHMAPTFMHETKTLCDSELLRRACLTPEEADEYMPKHAIYLRNVKAIEPLKINELYRDKERFPNDNRFITKAPQNMCWAWWGHTVGTHERFERVLVMSIRSNNLCNIANGLKDIETRRQVVNEIKEMEK